MKLPGPLAAACVAAALGPAPLCADPPSPVATEPPSALSRLAQAVTAQLLAAVPEAPLAVYMGGESAELARDFAALLISELALRHMGPIALSAPSAEAAELGARERGARSLARLSISLGGGLLQARGDLISSWVNFWSGQAATRSAQPAAAIFASTEADAPALALAASGLPPGSASLYLESAHFADLPQWTAALAAGDLDGDGRDEIIALTDTEILAFSPEGRLLARRDHRVLGDSPTPCREPFGAVWVESQRVAYFAAGRKVGERLALDRARGEFLPIGSFNEVPIAAAGSTQLWGSLLPGRSAFAPELRASSGERWSLRGPFWALSLFASHGGLKSAVAFADGTASWSDSNGHARPRTFRSGAAAIALIDIVGDGEPELVTTSGSYHPDEDELRVVDPRATSATSGNVRWHAPVRGGWALQVVGARLGSGKGSQIIVGLWKPDGSGELQVFRRVPR